MSMLKVHGGRIVDSETTPYMYVQGFKPSKLTTSGGTIKQITMLDTAGAQLVAVNSQMVPADGDRMYMYIYSPDGKETKIAIAHLAGPAAGIFDLYINGVLDSSGYDGYAAAFTAVNYWVTLTKKIIKGMNTIEFRINGKNVVSTDYYFAIGGVVIS